MRGSSRAERIDAGGVDPRRDNPPHAPLFRVHDRLSRLNANWTGAAERIDSSADREPRRTRPLRILGGVMMPLLAVGVIAAIQSHAKPWIEQEMADLGERLAQAMNIDCVGARDKGFPDDPPACR